MSNPHGAQNYQKPLVALTSLFFMWGLITSLNDILIPHLKGMFSLSYFEAALVQFCFFTAYFIVSFPAGRLVESWGFKRGIITGLLIAGAGCALFYPSASLASYPFFLASLFVLAAGITILQVAANPYVTILGPAKTASSRLNLTQAFNSLGTTVAPLLGAVLILTQQHADGSKLSAAENAASVQGPYLVLAVALVVIALAFAYLKLPEVSLKEDQQAASANDSNVKSVWAYRHLSLGVVAIFAYVGGEVSIGSFLVNFMEQKSIAALSLEEAGKMLSFYWGGAMIGRFAGSAIMRVVPANKVLAFNAAIVVVFILLSMLIGGHTAMWLMLGIGLFNSIMFPTIFSLALQGLGKWTSAGSGALCMAIVGGALMPVIQAWFADNINLLMSFSIPMVCYLYILFYGLKGYQPKSA